LESYAASIPTSGVARVAAVRKVKRSGSYGSFWGIEAGLARTSSDAAESLSLLPLGARQGSCRLGHAANGKVSGVPECVLTTASRSGLSVTVPMGDQLRVLPDQRAGLRSRAEVYSA